MKMWDSTFQLRRIEVKETGVYLFPDIFFAAVAGVGFTF